MWDCIKVFESYLDSSVTLYLSWIECSGMCVWDVNAVLLLFLSMLILCWFSSRTLINKIRVHRRLISMKEIDFDG